MQQTLNLDNMDNESRFLKNALDNYMHWKAEIAVLEKAGKDASKEKEYAEAFKIQLHGFTTSD
jgi:hypothetical protein